MPPVSTNPSVPPGRLRPSSALPVPTFEEVAEFRSLYARKFGLVLTPAEALDAATQTLQLYYLTRPADYLTRPAVPPEAGPQSKPETHSPCATSSTPASPPKAKTARSRALTTSSPR